MLFIMYDIHTHYSLQVLAVNPCRYCNQSPACNVFLHQKGKSGTIKIVSSCPEYYEKAYGHAKQANIPVICLLCDLPKDAEQKHPAIWKYNLQQHVLELHPSYGVPRWPAWDNMHRAQGAEGGKLLVPTNLAVLLNFGQHKEETCSVS